MNKKVVLIVIGIFIIGLLSYLCYNIVAKTKHKKAVEVQLQTLPAFEFTTLHNSVYTQKNLKPNTPNVFIYFNSDCDFCQHEAQSISDNVEKFKDVQLLFVSTEAIETIQQFSERYNLNNQQNITFLHDNNNHFSRRFDATTIPYILIYDKNQNLIKKHKGQLNAKGLLKALNP